MRDEYLPLPCYTATSTYSLGLTFEERMNVVKSLRELFDFYYKLLVQEDAKYNAIWEQYRTESEIKGYRCGSLDIELHHSKASNFSEGNTFVCFGLPAGYYFDGSVKGMEFGELTYVIYPLHQCLKLKTDYDSLISDDIKESADLYERITKNPDNRRIYLRGRVKRSDILSIGDGVIDNDHVNEMKLDMFINYALEWISMSSPGMISSPNLVLRLKNDFKFAEPLGNCSYNLYKGVEEFFDIETEKTKNIEMVREKLGQ